MSRKGNSMLTSLLVQHQSKNPWWTLCPHQTKPCTLLNRIFHHICNIRHEWQTPNPVTIGSVTTARSQDNWCTSAFYAGRSKMKAEVQDVLQQLGRLWLAPLCVLPGANHHLLILHLGPSQSAYAFRTFPRTVVLLSVQNASPLSLLFSESEEEVDVRLVMVSDTGNWPQLAYVKFQDALAKGAVDTAADITMMGGKLFALVVFSRRLHKKNFKPPHKMPRTYIVQLQDVPLEWAYIDEDFIWRQGLGVYQDRWFWPTNFVWGCVQKARDNHIPSFPIPKQCTWEWKQKPSTCA